MAGLLVAISETPGAARELVRRLLPRMLYFRWLEPRQYHCDHFSAAVVLPREVEPTVWDESDQGQFAAIFGECYGSETADSEPPDASVWLRNVINSGRPEQLAAANGIYNVVRWDGRTSTATWANDLTGSLLLFQLRLTGAYVCCSEPGVLEQLLQHDSEIDRQGIESLLYIGYQAGHGTCWKDISVLPPATARLTRVTESGLIQSDHPCPLDGQAASGGAGEDYFSLLRNAVKLRVAEDRPVCLPLSGGEDSRLLLGILSDFHSATQAVTLDGCQVGDASAASTVARAAGVPIERVVIDRRALTEFSELLRCALSTTCGWHCCEFLPLLGAINRNAVVPLGFLGGTLSGAGVQRRPSDMAGAGWQAATSLYWYHGQPGRAPGPPGSVPLGPPSFPICNAPETPEELLVNLYGRQRRSVSSLLRLAWNFGKPVCPFADRRLLRLAMRQSRAALFEQRGRRRAFRQNYPRLAALPSGNDAVAVRSVHRRRWKRRLRGTFVSRIVRRCFPALPRSYEPRRLGGTIEDATEALPHDLRERLRPLAAQASIHAGFALFAVFASGPPNLVDCIDSILQNTSSKIHD